MGYRMAFACGHEGEKGYYGKDNYVAIEPNATVGRVRRIFLEPAQCLRICQCGRGSIHGRPFLLLKIQLAKARDYRTSAALPLLQADEGEAAGITVSYHAFKDRVSSTRIPIL